MTVKKRRSEQSRKTFLSKKNRSAPGTITITRDAEFDRLTDLVNNAAKEYKQDLK